MQSKNWYHLYINNFLLFYHIAVYCNESIITIHKRQNCYIKSVKFSISVKIYRFNLQWKTRLGFNKLIAINRYFTTGDKQIARDNFAATMMRMSREFSKRRRVQTTRQCQLGVELSFKVRRRRRKRRNIKLDNALRNNVLPYTTCPDGVPGQIHLDSCSLCSNRTWNQKRMEIQVPPGMEEERLLSRKWKVFPIEYAFCNAWRDSRIREREWERRFSLIYKRTGSIDVPTMILLNDKHRIKSQLKLPFKQSVR